jgi:hypothetical protein
MQGGATLLLHYHYSIHYKSAVLFGNNNKRFVHRPHVR